MAQIHLPGDGRLDIEPGGEDISIGARIREPREQKGLSQGDIERAAGLLRCQTSRVENGHTVPSLEALDKLAKALDLELDQLFFAAEGKPETPRAAPKRPKPPRASEEAEVLKVFAKISKPNRRLLLDMPRKMPATTKGK